MSKLAVCLLVDVCFATAIDLQMASPEENAMMSRVTNLEDAIKGMKGISDHLGSKKGTQERGRECSGGFSLV
jgi:hypothetical protein